MTYGQRNIKISGINYRQTKKCGSIKITNKHFSPLYVIQTDSEIHTASYSLGARVVFNKGWAVGV
jgi:hypothetical protein